MMLLKSSIKNSVYIDQEKYLFFTGTSYLGTHQSKEFRNKIEYGLKKWGACYGSSRKSNIKLSIYNEGESLLSEILKTEATLTLSSGTLAGILSIKTLEEDTDIFFHLPKTHPSILPIKSEEIKINEAFPPLKNKKIAIVLDAISSLEIAPYDLSFIKNLSKHNQVYLVIDLSHYVGIFNDFSIFKFSNVETIFVSSLGKAYGVCGGFISGTFNFIERIKSQAIYTGGAGMSPAFLSCFVESQSFYGKQQLKLKEHCSFVYDKLKNSQNLKISKNYPVIYSSNEKLANYLLQHHIIITSFYYATSPKKLNRIVINAEHKKKQLTRLTEKLLSFENKILK